MSKRFKKPLNESLKAFLLSNILYFCLIQNYILFLSNSMAYNNRNYHRRVQYIVKVYQEAKERDIPDTRILQSVFPSYGIHLSYRQWMNIKSMKPSEYNTKQLMLF